MKILLVEDDLVLAGQLEGELGVLGHDVVTTTDAPQALLAIGRQPFDAVVLDRMLPSMDGMSVLQRMREKGVTLPVLILTALGRLAEKVEGLEAGADDYIVKPVDPVELNARLCAAKRSRDWAGARADTLQVGDLVISPALHTVQYKGVSVDLSKGEFGILLELAHHAGAVVTRDMLYNKLWGLDFRPSTNIADSHVSRLRQKLMSAGGSDPILTVRGIGYKLKG